MKFLCSLLALALLSPVRAALAQALTSDGATLHVSPGTTLYVAGGVLNKAGSTLSNAGTVQLTGDLTNAATLTSGGTLVFSGTANQTFAPGTATVAFLTQSNTGAAGQNTLAIAADLTVGTALVLTNGLVRTAPGATLTLPDGATLTGEAAGRYVQGNLRAVRTAVSGTAAVAFPNSTTLSPNGLNLGTVTITRTAGLQTAGVSYGTNLSGTNKGIDRVWTVTATGTPPTATTPINVALSWVADDDNGFNPAISVQLWRAASAAGPWVAQGAAGPATSRSFAANVTQLGALTLSNLSAPLPVVLTRFTADPQGDDALLQWATATEKNNDHFDVEASADGRTFRRLGQVAGQGNSSQAQQYRFTDKAIARYAADLVYYRLQQVDADGTATYSPVRTVSVHGLPDFAAQLYPNPVRSSDVPVVLVRTVQGGPVAWELTDAVGRTLLSQTVEVSPGTSRIPIPATNLATGVYLVRVQQGSHHQALKLVCE